MGPPPPLRVPCGCRAIPGPPLFLTSSLLGPHGTRLRPSFRQFYLVPEMRWEMKTWLHVGLLGAW